MKFVTYKQQPLVNLERVFTLTKSKDEGKYVIRFVGDNLRITWNFNYEYERDRVYDEVYAMSEVTEITYE